MSGFRTKMWSIALATLFAWVTTASGDTISNNYLCLPTQNDNNCSSSILSLRGDKYPTVNFTTVGVTRQSFREFMISMREHVQSGQPFHQIMTLRDPSYVTMSDRFLLVNLHNWADTPITLAIDVTNLYVVGYRSEDQSYFFPDAPPTSTLFTETTHNELPFESAYPDLEREAGSRRNIYLGMRELEESIQDLYHYRRGNLARSFIVVIQMISESVRFRYIENQILLNTITDNPSSFLPSGTMINLENSWQSLSSRIQQSVEGRFPSINLVNRYDDEVSVNSVTPRLVLNIAIMIFVCNNPNQPSQLSSPAFSTLATTPIVGSDDQHMCTDTPEPTVRIKGRNNLCVDVKDGFFNDGDPIILWPCKSSEDKNQLWTLKMDDTIRSNGMCMTVTSSKRVVIYTCNKVVPSAATKWQIWDNGTIINPDTGLVLTATTGTSKTELVMDTDSCTSGQGWVASNDTNPVSTPIVGYKDLCLQAQYGNYVWLQDCVSEQLSQQWAVYPDGTIRPNGNKDNCLTWESYPQGEDVMIDPCDGGAGQRWLFNNDGTISNLYTKLVLDVKGSDPSLHKIIVWTYHGGENQMWYSWFI